MFRIQYDTYAPDAQIDADEFTEGEDFVYFQKGGKSVAAIKTISILAIHVVEESA